ncbi:protein EVI2B [Hyperolius riggenbachi]|uniref:protein EVI2B n=1 Tax=Hyperolius riggenbachi TaxID=752182 RepID=UPI0035A3AE51
MDKGTRIQNDGSEESKEYLWVAATVIGVVLILMLVAIAGILIWRHYIRRNIADQTWAGPSPMADGNTQDDFNINECIINRNRSSSCKSTTPIVTNELHASQQELAFEKMSEGNSEGSQRKSHIPKLNILPPLDISANMGFSLKDPEGQQLSTNNLEINSLHYETHLPPPPDDQLFPLPPPIEEQSTNEIQCIQEEMPLPSSPQSDDNCSQIPLYQESMPDPPHSPNDDDELLPPPSDLI